jgi:hypothetical protein
MVNRLVSDNFRENRQISGRGCTSKYPKRCAVHLASPWVWYGKTDAKQPIVTFQQCLIQTVLVYDYTFPTTFAWYHPHHMVIKTCSKWNFPPQKKTWLCFSPCSDKTRLFWRQTFRRKLLYIYIYIYIYIKPKDQGFPRNVPFVNCHESTHPHEASHL